MILELVGTVSDWAEIGLEFIADTILKLDVAAAAKQVGKSVATGAGRVGHHRLAHYVCEESAKAGGSCTRCSARRWR